MNKVKILLSLSLTYILLTSGNGCREGVVNPFPLPNSPSLIQMWKPDNVYVGQKNLLDVYNKMRLQLHDNGDYAMHSTLSTDSGKWTYKKADSTLIMVGERTVVAKVLELTESKLRYRVENISDGIEAGTVFECSPVHEKCIYTIKGKISNPDHKNIPTNIFVSVFWDREYNPKSYYIWGKGTVDLKTMEYTISFEEYPTGSNSGMQCVNIRYINAMPNNGMFAVGKIILHTDAHLVASGTPLADFNSMKNTGKFWGAVNDRHIVFVSHSPSSFLPTSVKFPANFESGYNLGKRLPQLGAPDLLTPLAIGDGNDLVVSQNWNDFTFAEWRP